MGTPEYKHRDNRFHWSNVVMALELELSDSQAKRQPKPSHLEI